MTVKHIYKSELLLCSIGHHLRILLVQGVCAGLVLAPQVDLAYDLHIRRPAKVRPIVVQRQLVAGALAILVALELLATEFCLIEAKGAEEGKLLTIRRGRWEAQGLELRHGVWGEPIVGAVGEGDEGDARTTVNGN